MSRNEEIEQSTDVDLALSVIGMEGTYKNKGKKKKPCLARPSRPIKAEKPLKHGKSTKGSR